MGNAMISRGLGLGSLNSGNLRIEKIAEQILENGSFSSDSSQIEVYAHNINFESSIDTDNLPCALILKHQFNGTFSRRWNNTRSAALSFYVCNYNSSTNAVLTTWTFSNPCDNCLIDDISQFFVPLRTLTYTYSGSSNSKYVDYTYSKPDNQETVRYPGLRTKFTLTLEQSVTYTKSAFTVYGVYI